MAQLNLLPDVKIEYLRSTRQKRLVIGISLVVAAASVALMMVLAGTAYILQKKSLNDLNADITRYNNQLKEKPDLAKVLTVQNQLMALPGMHDDKPAASRLFTFLTQLTPTAASISQLDVDFSENLLTITGTADTLDVANTYIDTLKFTTFTQQEIAEGEEGETESKASEPAKAFKNVVLSQFTRNNSGANYTITLNFEPVIFDNAVAVKMSVPRIVSTRSSTEQPKALFQSTPSSGGSGAGAPTQTQRSGQ